MVSMALAPPPGSASLRLNSLQQRSALLANRELTLVQRRAFIHDAVVYSTAAFLQACRTSPSWSCPTHSFLSACPLLVLP